MACSVRGMLMQKSIAHSLVRVTSVHSAHAARMLADSGRCVVATAYNSHAKTRTSCKQPLGVRASHRRTPPYSG